MYHYVRELWGSRFPNIRGLTVSHFRAQISYMRRFYHFISANDLTEACHGGHTLSSNSALLTFDDGYVDHYVNVFPILDAAGIQGCFSVPVSAVREGRVLDVNKIHFVLATASSTRQLKKEIFAELDRLRSDGHEIAPNNDLYEQLAIRNDVDPPSTMFIKSLLQRELPEYLRTRIVDTLFRRHVTENEGAFARELYVSCEQLRTMVRHGMIIGGHGYAHRWMNTLAPIDQRAEIQATLEFLSDLGVSLEQWVMCYPYGAHNGSLLGICAELNCGIAFTTRSDIATADKEHALSLPRVDTNNLPKDEYAAPSALTKKVQIKSPVLRSPLPISR